MEIYKHMLENSGLQIHPSQIGLLKNQSVKQLIGTDDQFENIMRKAKNVQRGIQGVTMMSPSNKEFRGMIEDNVKQDLAKQIAKEISQNIKVTYKQPMSSSGKKKKSPKK